LLWPVSILWDPVSGYNAAETINYEATRVQVSRLKNRDMDDLESRLAATEIDMQKYVIEKRKIDNKYSSL
jgi:hypothetical protein